MNVRDIIMNIADRIKCEGFRRYLNPNIYPTNIWYRENLTRNFDMVNLGNEYSQYNFQVCDDEKRMNWGLKGQTLKQDFDVLKNFFSILKLDGMVIFPFYSAHELFQGWRDVKDLRPYYFDMQAYHFTKSHIRILAMKVAKHIPLLLIRPNDLWPLFKFYILKRDKVYELNAGFKRICFSKYDKSDVVKVKYLVENICVFCSNRNIKPVFVKMPILKALMEDVDYIDVFKGAMFLDLSKDREWTDATLYEVGGGTVE